MDARETAVFVTPSCQSETRWTSTTSVSSGSWRRRRSECESVRSWRPSRNTLRERLCSVVCNSTAKGKVVTPPDVSRKYKPVYGRSKKVQPAKDLSSIKIREAMNGAERKEGIENQAHPSGPDKLYGKWAVKRRAKQACRSCCPA